jgi:hypothetical protein
MKRFGLGILALAAFWNLFGCGDDRSVDNSIPTNGPLTHIRARVFAWGCERSVDTTAVRNYFDDFYGRSLPQLFNASEKRRARVTFYDSQERTRTALTDDSSYIAVAVPSGLYRIVIETKFSTPDTIFDYAVVQDTLIELDYVCSGTVGQRRPPL